MKWQLYGTVFVLGLSACSKQIPEAESEGEKGSAQDVSKRSFDPVLNAPPRVISALKDAGEKAAAGGAVTSAVVKGREASVAEDIREMEDSEARSLAMVQLMIQWANEDIETLEAPRGKGGATRATVELSGGG